MYKAGDDIRQDQLVLQLVTVMDKLLHRDGLDLKLTPYRCLATGLNDGIMEKVPNVTPLQDIFDDIHGHFRKYNFDENGEFQLTKDCLDNWMKSNAGYAVITFLLGIGYVLLLFLSSGRNKQTNKQTNTQTVIVILRTYSSLKTVDYFTSISVLSSEGIQSRFHLLLSYERRWLTRWEERSQLDLMNLKNSAAVPST